MRGAWVLFTVLLLLPRAAAAQRNWELAGGYAYLNDPPDRTDFPSGWIADAAVGLTDWLALVGDASAHWETTIDQIKLSTSAVTAGVRVSARIGRLTEFGQLLAGVVHSSSTVIGITGSDTEAAIQPGAGIDYPFLPHLAGRLQFDYRAIRGGIGPPIADPRHQFRFVAALVYRRPR